MLKKKFNDVMDEDDEDGFGDADAEDIFDKLYKYISITIYSIKTVQYLRVKK
jgi:hypothetical protein